MGFGQLTIDSFIVYYVNKNKVSFILFVQSN